MSSTIKRTLAGLLAVGGLLSAPAWAERADRTKPVQLDADSVHLDDVKKTADYEGHVVLIQGTMTMKADRIDISQDDQGLSSGVAVGKPVYFRQKMDNSDEYVEAEASRMEYDAHTTILKLIGSAHLKRGEDDLRGAVIIYDTTTERYQAQGSSESGGQGRVHAVIHPRTKNGAAAKP